MVQPLAYCFGKVAPYYNLVLVIVVVVLFVKLFKTPYKKTYLAPWKLLFAAVCVYIVEEIITVLHMSAVVTFPKVTWPLLEMAIITIFIYVLLLQREHVKK